MQPVKRRFVVQGAGALAFTVGGAEVLLTPREARAADVPFKVLTPDEARTLGAIGETMAPGAREQGVAHFVDQQCSLPPHEALLSLRIANAAPPFVNFYRAALVEMDRQSGLLHGRAFHELAPPEQRAMIDAVRQSKTPGWQGPPQRQVYGVFRDDAVDVVYGTAPGFEALGVPYMPHILPTERW